MFRRALGRAVTQISACSCSVTNPMVLRFCGAGGLGSSQEESVARQMIQYALSHARSRKSGESYAQAMLVLEQGVSNLQASDGDSGEDAIGLLLLAMSTLLYERGELGDAMEKLQMVHRLEGASLPVRVAALEGLVGLQLENGEGNASRMQADDCLQLLKASTDTLASLPVDDATSRAKAIKGLAGLATGELSTAELSFSDEDTNLEKGKVQKGSAALSYGEYLHATGNFSSAKDLYERIIKVFETKDGFDYSYPAAANMVPEEALLGATCALGQLLSQSGKFNDSEELLTKALNMAENHFGSTHPKVGVVLTCIALMFKHKARIEASSSILIQEGLYRRALDLLKAPGFDSEVKNNHVDRRDVVALARGGYAEILLIQQNRKAEGERMSKWAEATWRNHRLSLAQALEFSEPSQAPVIDTRISRVL
ncbi:putative tetratricopeptide-like helical domain superfamily [Dioscorea sansibarensis]